MLLLLLLSLQWDRSFPQIDIPFLTVWARPKLNTCASQTQKFVLSWPFNATHIRSIYYSIAMALHKGPFLAFGLEYKLEGKKDYYSFILPSSGFLLVVDDVTDLRSSSSSSWSSPTTTTATTSPQGRVFCCSLVGQNIWGLLMVSRGYEWRGQATKMTKIIGCRSPSL